MTQLPFSWLRWLSAIALISSIALSQGCGGDVGCGSDSNRVREEGTDLCLCREGTVEDPDTLQCNEVDAGTDAGTDGCVETTYYRDMDGDERGDPDMSVVACEAPEGFVEDNTDCDDDCNVCWTGAEEVCDEEDNDCDGFSDEGVTVPVGDPVMITSGGGARAQFTHSVEAQALDDGRYLIAYERAPDGDYVSRIFDPATATATPEQLVADTDGAFFYASARTASTIAFVFNSGDAVWGRAYSAADGSELTPARRIMDLPTPANPALRIRDLAVSSLGDGFVVGWEDGDENLVVLTLQRTLMQPFSGLEPIMLHRASDGDADGIRVAEAPDRDSVVVLSVFDGQSSEATLRARQFDGVEASPWETAESVPGLSSVEALIRDDELHVGLLVQNTPGDEDAGGHIEYRRYQPDWTILNEVEFEPVVALLFTPTLSIVGNEARLFSYRFGPSDDSPRVLQAAPSEFDLELGRGGVVTRPTALGRDGAIYMQGAFDTILMSDVAFRRFGCE